VSARPPDGRHREGDQARRGQGGFFDRRVRILLEEAQELARGDPLVPARILARGEHRQLERVDEAQLGEIRATSAQHDMPRTVERTIIESG
jgi:hypothetical protein